MEFELLREDVPLRPLTAIVPARGGSKRVPRKNIRPFLGTPLLARTIRTVLASGLFESVVVSTDDSEIAALAVDSGAEAPFVRSANLADDHATTRPVIADAIHRLEDSGRLIGDPVCVVYATAALLSVDDLIRSFEAFLSSDCDYLFAGAPFPSPIQRAWEYSSEDRHLVMRQPEYLLTRSQDLPPAYYDVGWIYWATKAYWLGEESKENASEVVSMYQVEGFRAVDIDTEDDWVRAELIGEALERRARLSSTSDS